MTLIAALSLAPGCAAHDGRYWSFPFNSNQMVENAALYDWTYGKALGGELALQLFPLVWIWSIFDVLMLPLTVPYDVWALASDSTPHLPFEMQVDAEKKKGLGPARPVTPSEATDIVPRVRERDSRRLPLETTER